jgi:hypothetical protein
LRTGRFEVDDGFFEGEAEFLEDDVGAVREGAAVVGVELDFGWVGLDSFVSSWFVKYFGQCLTPPLVPLTWTLVVVPLVVAAIVFDSSLSID